MRYHLTTALLLCAAATPLLAQESSSLDRLLPPKTVLYLEVQEPTQAEQAGLAVTACMQDPQMKALFGRLGGDDGFGFKLVDAIVGPGHLELGGNMDRFRMRVKYQVPQQKAWHFVITPPVAVAVVGPAENPDFPVDAVAALRIEGSTQDAAQALQHVCCAIALEQEHDRLTPIGAEVQRRFTTVRWRDLTYSKAEFGGVPLLLVPLGDLLVLATDEARVRSMIEMHLGGGEGSLARDERHRKSLDVAGSGTRTFGLTLNIDTVFEILRSGAFGPEAQQAAAVLSAMGFESIRGLVMASRVDGPGVTSTFSLISNGEPTGLPALLFSEGSSSLEALQFAPKDTLYVTSGRLDPAMLWGLMGQLGKPTTTVEQRFKAKTRLDLKRDLIDLIGGEAGLIVASTRGLLPDIALLLQAKDPKRLHNNLIKVLQSFEWPEGAGPQQTTIGGAQAVVLPLGHPHSWGIPLAPTFGVVDGWLIVAPFPKSFQRLVAVKRGHKPSLAQNRDFAKLRSRAPDEVLALSYMDLPRVFAFFYDTFMPFTQIAPSPQGQTPMYELPDASVFEDHLYGRIGWRKGDKNGMHWVSHSPVDMSGAFLGAIGGGVAVLLLAPSRQPAQMAIAAPPEMADPRMRQLEVCRQRVHRLRVLLKKYNREHDRLPASFDELKQDNPALLERVLHCPGQTKPGRRYVYLGPDGKNGVLMHGHPNGPRGRVTVVFVEPKTHELKTKRLSIVKLHELLGH